MTTPNQRSLVTTPIRMAGDVRPAPDGHTQLHRGKMFRAGVIIASVANDASIDVVLTTPAGDYPHLVFMPAIDGSADALIYEEPTFSDGTPLTAVNHKRTSSATWGGTIVHTPTVTNVGTQILGCHIPGGQGPQANGNNPDFGAEIILDAETSYLFRLTNRAGQAKRGSICLMWYSSDEIPDT